MNENRKLKQSIISNITNKINKASSVVIIQYHGLSVKAIQELRRNLQAQNCEIEVFKNTLFGLAAKASDIKLKERLFPGPNAYIFSYDENVVPFKIVAQFKEENPQIDFVAGFFEQKVVNKEQAEEIAKLPSKQESLEILARSLMAPVQQMGIALHLLIKENKLS